VALGHAVLQLGGRVGIAARHPDSRRFPRVSLAMVAAIHPAP
jgi:hypothetical protein